MRDETKIVWALYGIVLVIGAVLLIIEDARRSREIQQLRHVKSDLIKMTNNLMTDSGQNDCETMVPGEAVVMPQRYEWKD